MILYMENPKDSTLKLLELIQQFSNMAGYKINVQKSVAFLYTNNENTEREIRELIPFTIAPRTIRYLGINLTKEVKDLYSRNYRTLMIEIEEDTKRWKGIPCSWFGRINIVKMSVLLRAIFTFNAIPIKIPLAFFKVLEQTILKFVWHQKRPLITKGMLKKKTKLGHHVALFQAILQNCDHQDSMVLGQKQVHRLVEMNRESRYGPSTLWWSNLQQSRKKYPMEKRQSL